MQPTSNRHYRIFTRTHGNHEIAAQTKREAVARVVARLGLDEEQCAQVNTWAVAEVRAPSHPTEQVFGRGATETEVEARDPRIVWCSPCDVTDCALHGKDCLMVCERFHLENIEVKK